MRHFVLLRFVNVRQQGARRGDSQWLLITSKTFQRTDGEVPCQTAVSPLDVKVLRIPWLENVGKMFRGLFEDV